MACPKIGSVKIRPKNAGTIDNSMVIEMIAPQTSMTAGLSVTTRIDVSMAETKSVSRSSSMGIATTVTENRTDDRKAPIQVPIARKVQPFGVKKNGVHEPAEIRERRILQKDRKP